MSGTDSDISVTGWQVMALRAAKNLGCDVPAENIARAVDYIKRCQDTRGGGFKYMPYSHVTVPCTGTSVLALELCGKDEHRSASVLKGVGYLIRNENLPRWGGGHFFYGIYYGSQASFQVGENYWKVYSSRLHQLMLRHQGATGSWQGGSESAYGPNYCTSMAVLALTVEYRYLPIYQRGEEPKDRSRPDCRSALRLGGVRFLAAGRPANVAVLVFVLAVAAPGRQARHNQSDEDPARHQNCSSKGRFGVL